MPFFTSCRIPSCDIFVKFKVRTLLIGLALNSMPSLSSSQISLIQTALSRLIADKTVLVIAHRMRTVAGADKIVVLSDGTVAEEGSPKELAEKNGVYANMVKLQTENQSWKLE